ncbi:UPF0481 protein At3g47200-like [Impatiens glandulifera]|uniref:UPF0481 protein At3g47200-like n=1 Tax=Impatiens glandulifera TaxID=253017 RepID=UPI001FB07185|nr:UPF0481 protein At3g47200-like [Impatiens glandulifera]
MFESDDESLLEITRDEENLLSSIKQKIKNVPLSRCICRIPEEQLKGNVDKYHPQLVSIGPLHHSREDLRSTEDRKWLYLHALLSRSTRKPTSMDARLKICVNMIKESEHEARKFYEGNNVKLNSHAFVEMLLVDGCFIIELLLKYSAKELRRGDDPFFTSMEMFLRLRSDVLLLENQVPFFVLHRLFKIVQIPNIKDHSHPSIVTLSIAFFKRIIQREVKNISSQHGEDFKHLLDLVHNYYLPTTPKFLSSSTGRQTILPTASTLHKKWIRFKQAESETLLDINFKKGVIKIPPLKILDHTELLFRNFIAFEHCHGDKAKPVTSYVLLLRSLIQSEDDIRLLYKSRILVNGLERQEQILDMLKKIIVEEEETTMDMDFYYGGLREKIKEHLQTIKINRFMCF